MTVRRVPLVAALVALALVVDLVAAAVVHLDRRDAARIPHFRTADVSDLQPSRSPFAGRTADFGLTALDESGVPVQPEDYVTDPARTAVYALACLDLAGGDPSSPWLARAKEAVVAVLDATDDGLLATREADTDPFGDRLPVPGYSAASQGLMLSALARLHDATSDRRWRTEAGPVFEALLRFRYFFAGDSPAPAPWLSVVDSEGYLWFEDFTLARAPVRHVPDHSLTLLGVIDYHRRLAAAPESKRISKRLVAGGVATLRDALRDVRRPGQLALASLAAKTSDQTSHMVIQTSLAALADLFDNDGYRALARQLDRDNNLAPFRARAFPVREVGSPFSPLPDEFQYARVDPPSRLRDDGVVVTEQGAIHPSLTARHVLAQLDRYERTDDDKALRQAERALRTVLATGTEGVVPYRFPDSDAFGAELPVPWYSADGQGLLLAGASRMARITGDPTWQRQAERLFDSLLRYRDFGADGEEPARPWTSLVDDDGYVWFETYPTGLPPSLLLHVQLSTLLGVYEYWSLTGDPLARHLVRGAATTVRAYLPMLRRDDRHWNSVALRSPSPEQTPLIDAQLRALARITGDETFTRYSKRDS